MFSIAMVCSCKMPKTNSNTASSVKCEQSFKEILVFYNLLTAPINGVAELQCLQNKVRHVQQ